METYKNTWNLPFKLPNIPQKILSSILWISCIFISFHGLSCSFCSGKISSLGCYIERLRCCCWNEYTQQCLLWLLNFFPFLSLAPILRIFLYYITRKDRAVETISPTRRRRKKQNQKTLCAIILSFLSKVAYFFLVKIITCKMLQENIKILFGQSKNNPQGWMWLVTEARSDVAKSNIA